jgi:hypothetical protein
MPAPGDASPGVAAVAVCRRAYRSGALAPVSGFRRACLFRACLSRVLAPVFGFRRACLSRACLSCAPVFPFRACLTDPFASG